MAPSRKQLLHHSPKRSCSSDARGSSRVLEEQDYEACYLGRGSCRRWLRLRLVERVSVLARVSGCRRRRGAQGRPAIGAARRRRRRWRRSGRRWEWNPGGAAANHPSSIVRHCSLAGPPGANPVAAAPGRQVRRCDNPSIADGATVAARAHAAPSQWRQYSNEHFLAEYSHKPTHDCAGTGAACSPRVRLQHSVLNASGCSIQFSSPRCWGSPDHFFKTLGVPCFILPAV